MRDRQAGAPTSGTKRARTTEDEPRHAKHGREDTRSGPAASNRRGGNLQFKLRKCHPTCFASRLGSIGAFALADSSQLDGSPGRSYVRFIYSPFVDLMQSLACPKPDTVSVCRLDFPLFHQVVGFEPSRFTLKGRRHRKKGNINQKQRKACNKA